MNIFLDESGDLGWKFDLPNHNGGSSRYITIAGIIIDQEHTKYLNREVSDLYKLFNLTPGIEKKGANFSEADGLTTVNKLVALKSKATSLKIISITVRKENVYQPLKRDTNILYNYALGLLLVPDVMRRFLDVELVLDKRTIKVLSGNSFSDYIKTLCWGNNIGCDITCAYDTSDKNQGIWVADWIANFIWRHYENGQSAMYNKLRSLGNDFIDKRLFF